jgi:hypothetical protein
MRKQAAEYFVKTAALKGGLAKHIAGLKRKGAERGYSVLGGKTHGTWIKKPGGGIATGAPSVPIPPMKKTAGYAKIKRLEKAVGKKPSLIPTMIAKSKQYAAKGKLRLQAKGLRV